MTNHSGTTKIGNPPFFSFPNKHPEILYEKIGALLVNLGTPDEHSVKAVRRYLREFLSDKRIIEWSRFYWYPILYGIILNRRPQKSALAYRSIWNHDLDESPLRTFSRSQAEKLSQRLEDESRLIVDWAMRYGSPSIEKRLEALVAQGCDRILIFPLYPQYSATTTASVNDKAFITLMNMRAMPAIRTVPPYHDHPVYIGALVQSIREHLNTLEFEPEKIIVSYHGIPKNYFDKGDYYYCHCQKTSQLLGKALGFDEDRLVTCFQSRFGPEEWLQPYTDQTIEEFAKGGIKKLAVLTPGFVSDCLETLEEIKKAGASLFHQYGGECFSYIPCLNDSDVGMNVIEAIVRNELKGWL